MKPGHRRERGFTLVELMVALALAAMISVAIMIISNQAREVYEVTTRKVEVYNKFRLALLSMERDFSQWIPTANLEFFNDGRGSNARINDHWDEGEEAADTRDERGKPGVVDGGTEGEYDEFAYILERHYVGGEPDGTRKIHDAYQVYLRTMTYVDGKTREANVEYMLLDPNRPDQYGEPQPPTEVHPDRMRDLTLYKIIRYHEFNYGEILKPTSNFPIKRRLVEVCANITDFRVEYTTDNRFDNRVSHAFRTPREDYEQPAERAIRPEVIQNPATAGGEIYKKLFGYGSFKIDKQFTLAVAYRGIFGDRQGTRGDHRPTRFGFEQSPDIKFAELTPGDKIFIYTEGNRGPGAASPAQQGLGANAGQFPSGRYTVKTNLSGRLEFREDLNPLGLQRDVPAVKYSAPFLPDAVRITLRVVDENRGEEPKTLQRVVWVRQKSR